MIWRYPETDEFPYTLNDIHFVNSQGWAVGESGLIVQYTIPDQWQARTDVTDLPLNDVFFSDEDHGWIAGGYLDDDNPQFIFLRTNDGGETWAENRDLNYQINDMYFDNSLHGWAVGSDTSYNGIIIETIDGGMNWIPQVEGLIAPLTAIRFKDGYGWAVGEAGLVLRTEDGITWVDQNTDQSYPNAFYLSQNYPNPFNPSTAIRYDLPKAGIVLLKIYNALGQEVRTLINERQSAGEKSVVWDGKHNDGQSVASGIYIYQMKAGEYILSRKMLLVR